MANEMLHRISRAIAEGGLRALQERMGYTEEHIAQQTEAFRDSYLDYARYALEAMREPTDTMLSQGVMSTGAWQNLSGSAITVNLAKMKLRYQAMIDAALKE